MISFPKKYKKQDLTNRAKIYREKNSVLKNENFIYYINHLNISQKTSYKSFYTIYLNDFFIKKKYIENNKKTDKDKTNFEQLFLIKWNQFYNICNTYDFFQKKNQSRHQIWTDKVKRHVLSQMKKYFTANKKILDSYLSTQHKLYIPDSDMYLYIIEKIHQLRNEWKIFNETKIVYRSFNLQTSIPNSEIVRKEENVPYYTIKYFVGAKCEALPVCVQDIDLCCWDVALLVHPKDKRYNKYIWRNAIIPLCNRQIPIIWDENVNIAINNWIKRICPCSDKESLELAKKYWLQTNIYVFDKKWFYTNYIHEQAFIWQDRNKYYNNIIWFIEDIWNLAEKWEKSTKIPYLKHTNERLIPYKMEEFIIDLSKEKEKILNKIFNGEIELLFTNESYWKILDKLKYNENIINSILNETWHKEHKINIEWENEEKDKEIENLKSIISQLKQEFSELINLHLPNYITCNRQLPYWWKFPIIRDKEWLHSFFDIKNSKTEHSTLQNCFNLILLYIIRAWIIWTKNPWSNHQENKICEYDKIFVLLSQNEKTIEYFIQNLSNKYGNEKEYNKILQIIQNLTDENNSTINDCSKLIENCKFIKQEWNQLLLNMKWITNDTIDTDFYQSCTPCYLYDNNININNTLIIDKREKTKIFTELLIQELLLWKTLFNKIIEFPNIENNSLITKNSIKKPQYDQSQREFISLYWENPLRLNLLIDQTYNQESILLNSIFLKQIWNAIRLCIQKNFLPQNIKECLNNQPNDFNDFDISVLYKLNELYKEFIDIKTYEEYIKFFNTFKKTSQNIFFSRYIEIQKFSPSKNVQFVCSYFFNFLLTILYPLIPEFIDALQYISKKSFLLPIKWVNSIKAIDYNMNILYNTFVKIKEIKLECNIKQHEPCNIFIKSNPSILEFFINHDSIFKNYFHIPEILYLRLHEQTPLWYDIFEENELTIWIQSIDTKSKNDIETIETLERDIKNLEDKLQLLRQRIQILPEWEQRTKAEEEYTKTKEEMETLTIKHSLLKNQ